jgi:hypothetical protein
VTLMAATWLWCHDCGGDTVALEMVVMLEAATGISGGCEGRGADGS